MPSGWGVVSSTVLKVQRISVRGSCFNATSYNIALYYINTSATAAGRGLRTNDIYDEDMGLIIASITNFGWAVV